MFGRLGAQAARRSARRRLRATPHIAHRARARHALCRPGLRDHDAVPNDWPSTLAASARETSTSSTSTMFGHTRAGGAGRDRVLSGARHRPRAAGRRCRASRAPGGTLADALRETRPARFDGDDARLPGLSARAARRRAGGDRARRSSTSSIARRVICPGQMRARVDRRAKNTDQSTAQAGRAMKRLAPHRRRRSRSRSKRASPASCRRCRTRCSAPASPPSCANRRTPPAR